MEPITDFETTTTDYFDSPAIDESAINIGQVERIISIAGGALLLMAGLSKIMGNSTGSFLKAVAGGYLLYRGATGHCMVNQAIGRNTADEETEF